MSGNLHVHLRAHRIARGLTLMEVANALGSRENTISQWERGLRTVDLETLERLANVYKIHPIALLLSPEEGPKAESIREASDLATKMDSEALANWLGVGRAMADKATPGS